MGFVASLVAAPVLMARTLQGNDRLAAVGAAVFVASLLLLYLASTLYHAFPPGRAKRALRIVEHGAIYLLIAGTYTPFTLGVLRGPWGFALLGLVWTLAATGITLKTVFGIRYPAVSTALYLAMGWLIVVAARTVWLQVPVAGVAWLVAGGLAYTIGVGFYTTQRHAVRALRLAPVRARRHDVSLPGHPVVRRGLTSVATHSSRRADAETHTIPGGLTICP